MSREPLRVIGLRGLAVVHAELLARERAAEAAARAADAAERAARSTRAKGTDSAASDHELFRATVGTVFAIHHGAAPALARAKAPAVARQRRLDDAAALAESIAGRIDGEALIESDDGLSFRRPGVGSDIVRKLRRGVWVLQGELDLHGLNRDAARDRLAAFLADAARTGRRCVRVVHGKGHGSPGRTPVLKDLVRRWLAQCGDVLAYVQARPAEGGAGAIVVLLRGAQAAAARGR